MKTSIHYRFTTTLVILASSADFGLRRETGEIVRYAELDRTGQKGGIASEV